MGAIARTARYALTPAAVRVPRHLIEEFKPGPMGVISFAVSLGIDDDNPEPRRDIEPPLVRAGLIRRLPRSRAATRATHLLLGMTVPLLINGLT